MNANLLRLKWLFATVLALAVFVISVFVAVQVYKAASPVLWETVHSDVAVKIEVKKSASGQMELQGTFKPTRENFHLYSKDLPKKGIRGIGRPTLLEVVSSPDTIKWTGELKVDQSPHDIFYQPMNLTLSVYPSGPVTLALPFEWVGNPGAVSLELSMTYMACSDQTCLSPVMDKHFTVTIPSLQ